MATHHALARIGDATFADGISQPWLNAHEAFHVAILNGCGNPYLVTAAVRLRSIYEVYRCWSRPENVRTHRDVADEHRRMMESVIAREVDVATQLTQSHIRRTTELLISGLEAEPAAD